MEEDQEQENMDLSEFVVARSYMGHASFVD